MSCWSFRHLCLQWRRCGPVSGRFIPWVGLHEPSEAVLRQVQQAFGLHDLAIDHLKRHLFAIPEDSRPYWHHLKLGIRSERLERQDAGRPL